MNFRCCFFLSGIVNALGLCFFSLTLCAFPLTGCDSSLVSHSPEAKRFCLMTYNTQAFFDAVEDGSEFSEYRGTRSKWSKEKYVLRLDRLREVLLLCGAEAGMGREKSPDIAVLQEIENDRVLRDICNRLPRQAAYPWAVFVPPAPGCAFGTAVLSRFPVESVTVHNIAETGPALRPLLEVRLRLGETPLVVFAVHWKSKSDDDDTAPIRAAQEALLSARIEALEQAESGTLWIACGDFNQRRDECVGMARWHNCWDTWLERCDAGWIPGPAGSYCFQSRWETIDNIFYADSLHDGHGLEIGDFEVVSRAPLLDGDSTPARYELYNGSGYSDHLPLLLEVKRVD